MAKVKYGAAVSELRGSISGATYSRNAGGSYVRARISPVQPNSARQAAAKSLFSAGVNTWTNTLSGAERVLWAQYAASVPYVDVFGQQRYYSGQQRYVQAFVAAVNAGRSVASVAAAPSTYTEAENVTVANLSLEQGAAVADGTANVVNAAAPAEAAADDILLISFGAPVTPARNYFKGPYRHAGIATYVSGGTYPDALLTDPFGRTCAEGQVIPVQWRVLKVDNRLSPISQAILTVAAYPV